METQRRIKQGPVPTQKALPVASTKEADVCACLNQISDELKAQYGDVELCLKLWMDNKTFSMASGLPPLEFRYMKGKKVKKSYVRFLFCPFCGKKGSPKFK